MCISAKTGNCNSRKENGEKAKTSKGVEVQ